MIFALNVMFVGIFVVFLSLILLSVIIALFSRALAGRKTKTGGGSGNTNTDTAINNSGDVVSIDNSVDCAAQDSVISNEIISASAVNSIDDDTELVAVITAAIIAGGFYTSPGHKLIVRSIRRLPQISPIWNIAGRTELISNKL